MNIHPLWIEIVRLMIGFPKPSVVERGKRIIRRNEEMKIVVSVPMVRIGNFLSFGIDTVVAIITDHFDRVKILTTLSITHVIVRNV